MKSCKLTTYIGENQYSADNGNNNNDLVC